MIDEKDYDGYAGSRCTCGNVATYFLAKRLPRTVHCPDCRKNFPYHAKKKTMALTKPEILTAIMNQYWNDLEFIEKLNNLTYSRKVDLKGQRKMTS